MTDTGFATVAGRDGKDLKVGENSGAIILAANGCSDGRRRFYPAKLAELVERTELAGNFNGWYEDTDLEGRPFAVRLLDGRFIADETIRPVEDCRVNVSWSQFMRSAKARAKWS